MNDVKNNRLKYYVLPLLMQFGVLGVCIPLHRLFVHLGPYIGNPQMVGMEMSDPTAGRLVYAIFSFIAFTSLTLYASHNAEKGDGFASFIPGIFAGTFLWQSIGEDIWHFSVNGIHFVSLESITVFPLVILFILTMIFSWKKGLCDWGIWCVVLAFSINWLGHYVLIGIYPLFSDICDINSWCSGVGITLGSLLIFLSLFLGLGKSKAPKERILSAMLSYYAIAVLAFGIIGV